MELPKELGRTPLSRLKTYYQVVFEQKLGFKPKFYYNKPEGSVLKRLLKEYGELEAACLITLHCNWHGANGRDTREYETLRENAFPLTWLPSKESKYLIYFSGFTYDEYVNFIKSYWKNNGLNKFLPETK